MAAILLLRRGTTPSTTQAEPYFNTQKETLQIGTGTGTVTLARMDTINTGSFLISGDISASNILVSENITLGGTIILGNNSSSDEIIVNASLSGSIIPETTSVYDLGASDKKYRNLYVVSASIDSISLPGSGILSSSNITFASYTGSTNEFTSSINSKFVTLGNYTSSIDSDLNKLHLYTQSNDLDITELFGTASNHADDIYSLQIASSLHNSRIYQLETTSSYLAITFSQSVDFRLDEVESTSSYFNTSFSQSVYSDFDELFYSSSDHEDRIDSLESVDASYGIRINNLEIFSSSEESKNNTLATYTGSIDNKFITLSSTTASILEFTSSQESKNNTLGTTTASLQLFTSSQESKNSTLANYTGSIDSKFDVLETYTSSVSNAIYHLNQYSQSLRDAVDVNGQNLTIFGDLTVQGTTTTLNTTELIIEDKVLSLASGSTTSAQADGAGLHISGANVSILWKDNETLLHTNAKLSSSVGFKGDGSELTDIQYSNVSFNGSGIVSGSAQVTSSLDMRYLMIEGDSVVSGSSQIDLTQTTNYVNGIKERLNAEGVISGSSQITNGSGLLSSSNENFEQFSSSVDFRLDTLQLFTSSQESKNSTLASYTASVDGKFLSLENYTASVDGKFLSLENYTASINSDLNSLHSYTQSNDIDVNNLFNTSSQYYSFSSSIDTIIKNKINLESVVSSSSDSSTIDFTITNGVISGNVIGGIVSGSNQLTSSLNNLYEVSGSVASLIGIRTTSGSLGSAAWYNVSASISDGNPSVLGSAGAVKDYIDEQLLIIGAGDITAVVAGNGMSGGANSGPATLSLDTSSQHFSSGVISSISSFSSSVDFRIDSLESFSSSLDLGFVTQTELATATGSLIDSIATKLNTGSYNTDSQSFDSRIDALELFSTSLDDDFVTQTELATATGSLINSIATKLNTGSYNTDSASFDTRLDLLESYSSSNFVPTASFATSTTQVDVYVKNMSGAQINKGTVVKISGAVGDNPLIVTASYDNELGSANTLGITTTNIPNEGFGWVISEGVLLGVNTDGMSAGDLLYLGATGSFINTTPTAPKHSVRLGQVLRVQQNNGSIYVRIDNGAELEELHNVIDTSTNSSYGDVLMKSGSVWVNNSTFSSSIDSTFVNLNAFSSSINTTIKNKLNNDSVLSGSLSTLTGGSGIVSSSNQVTSSLDTRYVNLSGSQTITGTKTFTDIVVNGTGSFARIESVTSQATIIGSSFVVVNTNTPTQRYAGLTVYDSGSTLSTASLYFDGQLNDWNYEYSSSAGIDYAAVLFAPSYGTKGSPTYPTSNKIQKGTGNHHLADSNITDNGTTITLGSNVVITGTLSANGIVSGSTFTSPSQGTLRATINGAQTDVDLGLQTTDEVQFAKVGIGGAADATYELKVTGDIGATGDIVAYISSDRRLKDEITPISNPLEKINQIGGYSFIWNEEKQNIYKGKDYGVIAQEIESILPELVENRDNGYKAVKYDRLVSLLIEGIKELSNEVNELKSKLEK